MIEFFSDEIFEPDTNLLQMISAIATQIGQLIQQRSSSLLEENEQKYRRIFETPNVSMGE